MIHNVPTREERREAIREIVRVLKPRGQVVLSDLKSTGLYADELWSLTARAPTNTFRARSEI